MLGVQLIISPSFECHLYGDALILSLHAFYSLEDFGYNGPQAFFYNPTYLSSLAAFWHAQGIHSLRLSNGIMMVILALKLCNNIHLYGFWPFEIHTYTHRQLSNHYYDDKPLNHRVHAMPAEFDALLNLHKEGVIHLHTGECMN
ncbi:alpha-N-acetylneuraminide alpha-2,8-sialyltransferase-like [Tachysurus ichikawai]